MNIECQNTCVHTNEKVRVERPKFLLDFCQEIENKKVRVDCHTLKNQGPKMGLKKVLQALRWLENGPLKSQGPKMAPAKAPQALRWLEKSVWASGGLAIFQIMAPQGIMTS